MVSRINEENDCWDVPGGTVDKNLPDNTGDAGSIAGQGMTIPHATRQLNPRTTVTEPAL